MLLLYSRNFKNKNIILATEDTESQIETKAKKIKEKGRRPACAGRWRDGEKVK